jgi:hypothetical protein
MEKVVSKYKGVSCADEDNAEKEPEEARSLVDQVINGP